MIHRHPNSKIAYVEMPMQEVIDYFIKGFKPTQGKVLDAEHFYDPYRARIIFKLVIDETPPASN